MGAPDAASRCLRIGFALQSVAAAYLAGVHYSPVNTWLLMRAGYPEPVARRVDLIAASLLLLGAVCALLRPARTLYALTGIWMALVALATYVDRGNVFATLAPWAQSLRFVVPLVLILWWPRSSSQASRALRGRGAAWLLRLALAATFGAHGLEALAHHPTFVDLAIGTARRLAGWRLDQAAAELVLTWIGAIDLLLALGVLVGRWRWLVGYMAFWGLATAFSRMFHSGPASWYATLLRAENFMAPLALWFLWRPAPTDIPTNALDPAPDREPRGAPRPAD